MASRHVFVETNWVVDFVAPAISRNPGAAELLERSRRGELELHVPAIALSEARKVIRERTPRADLDNIRAFVRQLRESDDLDEAAANAVFDALARFQQYVQNEKIAAPKRIEALLHDPAIEVFHLDEAMLERSVQLSAETALELQSFDVAILAAIVVRATDLHAAGDEVSFCTLDTDLQPWDRNGKRKHELANLLDTAGIWVYADFLLETPPRPGP